MDRLAARFPHRERIELRFSQIGPLPDGQKRVVPAVRVVIGVENRHLHEPQAGHLADDLARPNHCGIESFVIADLHDAIAARRGPSDHLGLGKAESERLLHKYMLARVQRAADEITVHT